MDNFRQVKGFEGHYSVSDDGKVYSHKRNIIMKLKLNTYGYLTIHLKNGDINKHPSVHRLVAEAFIPNPENKPTVNHIDGNKQNNHVSNLEWSTHKEQMDHAIATGLVIPRGNSLYSPEFKLQVKAYFIEHGCSIAKLASTFGISQKSAKSFTEFETRACIKISEDSIPEIIRLRKEGNTLKHISELFNCGISQIHRITRGESRNVQYLK